MADTKPKSEPVAEPLPEPNPNEHVLVRTAVRSLEDLEGPRRPSGVVHPNGQSVGELHTPTEPDPLDGLEPVHAPLSKAADTAGTKPAK